MQYVNRTNLLLLSALLLTATFALLTSQPISAQDQTMTSPTYTFVSVSTAQPGRLDDLIRIASSPSELMDEHIEGLIARQVSVDRDRNAVVVWVTFDRRESLYDFLATEQGRQEHGEDDPEMQNIIETFDMYDLVPVSGRL